jgi:hypothetical protein
MKTIKYLTLTLAIFLPLTNFAQTKATKPAITLATADAQGRVAIAVTFAQLQDQKFVLEIPELFTNKEAKGELFNYSKQVWNYTATGANMILKDDKYEYAIVLTFMQTKKSVGLKWNISFTNNSTENVNDLVAFNCWTMNFAPLFKDVAMQRTFVTDSLGKKITLASVRKTQGQGRRNMQYYSANNSNVNLYQSPWISQWAVISNQYLSGKCISVLAKDGKWLFENKVDGPVAFFFNNWEEDHGCVHASPLLAKELKPGQIAKASGTFNFTRVKK